MQVWNVLHAARWKYRTQKSPKSRHVRTIALFSGLLQRRHVLTIRKKVVKPQYHLHMSSQYGEPRTTNCWDRLASLGHPGKFQRVSRVGFVTAPTSLNQNRAILLSLYPFVLHICAQLYHHLLKVGDLHPTPYGGAAHATTAVTPALNCAPAPCRQSLANN